MTFQSKGERPLTSIENRMPAAKHMQNHFTLVLKLSVEESKIWQENNGRMSQDTSHESLEKTKLHAFDPVSNHSHHRLVAKNTVVLTSTAETQHSCAAQICTHHHNTYSRGWQKEVDKYKKKGQFGIQLWTQCCTAQQVAQAYLGSSFLRMRVKNYTCGQCLL